MAGTSETASKGLDAARKAREAKREARELVLSRHAEEFDELHRKARVDRGLSERPGTNKLEILREQLREAGIEPKL